MFTVFLQRILKKYFEKKYFMKKIYIENGYNDWTFPNVVSCEVTKEERNVPAAVLQPRKMIDFLCETQKDKRPLAGGITNI